jgi:hypothetical protein
LLGALAAAALVEVFEGWPLERRLGLGVSLAAATLGLGVLAVVTVHAAHDRNRTRTDAVLAAAEAMPPAADGGRPVVVTEDEQIPRLARGRYGEVRFLNVSAPYVGIYLDRLAARGVRDVLVVSKEPDATLDLVPDAYEEVGAVHPQPLQYTDDGGLIRLHLRARP